MKKLTRLALPFFATSMLVFMQIALFAQDNSGSTSSSSTTRTTTTTTQWYAAPWAWVVGGVVLLVILIALFRGKSSTGTGRTDQVTVTKRTETDI